MLDEWFQQEIEEHFDSYDHLLLSDPDGEYEFLLDDVDGDWSVSSHLIKKTFDDIRVKYEIEKQEKEQQVLIYSRIPEEDLRYCREYAETNPAPENLRKSLSRFVQSRTDLADADLDPDDYVLLGRQSVGKGKSFWEDVARYGIDAVLGDFEQQAVEFLSEPEVFREELDNEVWPIFQEKLENITGLSFSGKPAQTIAEEVTEELFDRLLDDELTGSRLQKLYEKWLNHRQYCDGLKEAASRYDIPDDLDVFTVASDHPFPKVDRIMAKQVINHLGDEQWISKHLSELKKRSQQTHVLDLIGVQVWPALLTLLEADLCKEAHEVDSIDTYIDDLFTEDLTDIHAAVRELYTVFTNDVEARKRIEQHYTDLMRPYWNTWFDKFDGEYEADQSGLIEEIFNSSDSPRAVIVGDAITYGLAKRLMNDVSGTQYERELVPVRSGYPSTTEHNKSLLFGMTDTVSNRRSEREDQLQLSVEGTVEVHNLDEFSPGDDLPEQLVLYQNDTDDLLEKLSGAGLKYLSEMQNTLQKHVKELIKAGYESVDIVSDHGFVLYGHVEEADKINPNKVAEDIDRSERFLASKVPISNQPPNTIHLKKNYKEFRHLYFAKGLKPFRSPNEYGFAHGGILPQELITPHLTITAAEATPGDELSVGITNKEELSEQPVRQFTVRLEAGPASDVMNASRNVLMELYRDDELIDSEVVEIDQNQEIPVDFSVDEAENLQAVVLDADTRKTIDTTNVRFESPRDLGGLE